MKVNGLVRMWVLVLVRSDVGAVWLDLALVRLGMVGSGLVPGVEGVIGEARSGTARPGLAVLPVLK